MLNAQKLKLTACALTGVMAFSVVGLSANAAEASAWHPERAHHQELSHRHQPSHSQHHQKNRNTHSQGDVNTAAIVGVAVGAIAGAIIANNT